MKEESKKTKWELSIPWFNTIASIIVLAIIGLFLVNNIEWFKNSVFEQSVEERNNPEYRFYAYQMHLSMIKRSVGLFSGFAIMFLGMSVVFFTIKEKIAAEIKNSSVAGSLATNSPGIIAILLGGYLIIATIESKDIFPGYNPKTTTAVASDSTEQLIRPAKP